MLISENPDQTGQPLQWPGDDLPILTIDDEFRALIPAPTRDELDELERSLLAEGCRDALITWQGVLLDGHNRYEICTRHGLAFEVREYKFEDRAAAEEWIIRNQFGRRNLSPYARSELALKLKAVIAARAKERQRSGKPIDPKEIFPQGQTRDMLGEIAGVSGRTLDKVETIERDAPDAIKQKARAGDMSTHRAYEMTRALKDADPDIVEVVARYDVDEPETVDVLKRLKKSARTNGSSDTFGEILATGYIQPGEEEEAVHVSEGYKRVSEALSHKSKIHQQLANDDLRRNPPALPDGLYNVILADPPWQYEHVVTPSRDIENQYPTMQIEDICALPIPGMVDQNAILFLWCPASLIRQGLAVVDAWGFDYRAQFVWVKDRIGMGYFTRSRHELLFVATKGAWRAPEPSARFDSVIEQPRQGHSVKPPCVYDMIEAMYPDGTRLELFARASRSGWVAWGNQIDA